jgi:hypothetical protein
LIPLQKPFFKKNQSIFCACLCAVPQDIGSKAAKIDQNRAFRSGINILLLLLFSVLLQIFGKDGTW